jgi:hypothetical protein
MKNPEEYLQEFGFFEKDTECGISTYFADNVEKRDLCRIINQIQIDAYNEALDNAVEEATCSIYYISGPGALWRASVDRDSILKLKKNN